MKESTYKNYEALPLILNAEAVAAVLGISLTSAYELMHQPGFPTLKLGRRLVVPKEDLISWIRRNTHGNVVVYRRRG